MHAVALDSTLSNLVDEMVDARLYGTRVEAHEAAQRCWDELIAVEDDLDAAESDAVAAWCTRIMEG